MTRRKAIHSYDDVPHTFACRECAPSHFAAFSLVDAPCDKCGAPPAKECELKEIGHYLSYKGKGAPTPFRILACRSHCGTEIHRRVYAVRGKDGAAIAHDPD